MTADLIADFDHHFRNGRVYLAHIELPMSDGESDVSYTVDYYLIANSVREATFLANATYPDAVTIDVERSPVTPEQYASRND